VTYGLACFALVLVSAGLMLGLAVLYRKSPPTFREIPAFTRLKEAIGRAVEDGSRLHVSLGRGGLVSQQSIPALAGLNALRRVADLTSASDQPPIATSGDTGIAILSQDTLMAAHQSAATGAPYDASAGRLVGLTPFSYAVGTIPVMRDENVSANVLVGNFGVEVGLVTDVSERQDVFTLAASDSLPAQAVIYASAGDPLVGEELYAVGAYLDSGPLHQSSLKVQDILRWIVVIVMLVGAVLKMLGVL
jgi:hypothetical protein